MIAHLSLFPVVFAMLRASTFGAKGSTRGELVKNPVFQVVFVRSVKISPFFPGKTLDS